MKLSIALIFLFTTLSMAHALVGLPPGGLLPLKGCSGDRKPEDECTGKKLRKQNSFHNCKNQDGKCCSKDADGSGGIDVNKGSGEDCGYCWSGKCKA